MNFEALQANFQAHMWLYLSMPLLAAFIGYITKLLALEMMFRPMEFIGIKPWLGWQGIIPRKAEKMALTCTDLLMGRLLNPADLLKKLDPDRILREMGDSLDLAIEEMVDEIGSRYMPVLWEPMPSPAKRQIVNRIRKQIPKSMNRLWGEVSANPENFIDVKNLLVGNLVKDKVLLNKIFRRIGKKEFLFFRNAGFWFGLSLGFIQLLCWLIWQERWLLPAFGGMIGLVSDWLALQMLFRPLDPKTFLGMRFQGRFIARQKEVSKDYAELVSKQLFTPANMVEEVLRGPYADRLVALIETEVETAFQSQMGIARPLVKQMLGSAGYEELREMIVSRILEMLPESAQKMEDYALEAMDLNNIVCQRMQELSPTEFESMLRPAFKEDEKTLVICGAVLGFLIGELQVQLLLPG